MAEEKTKSAASRLDELEKGPSVDVAGMAGDAVDSAVQKAQNAATVDGAKDLLAQHGGQNGQRVAIAVDQLQAMQKGQNTDIQSMAKAASAMGVGGQAGAFLDHMAEHADPNKAGEVPGLIVDRDSGKVKLFGMDNMEVPPQYAAILASAYTFGVNFINGYIFKHGYRAGQSVGNTFNLSEASRHRAGLAAAYFGIGAMTHWIDVNQFYHAEKQYRKDYRKLAKDFGPSLDEVKGSHDVAALMSVRQSENEVIYNERRRMHFLNNAERAKHFAQMLGRGVQFTVSAIEGHRNIGPNGSTAAITQAAADASSKEKYMEDLKAEQEKLKEKFSDTFSEDQLFSLAKDNVGKAHEGKGPLKSTQSQLMQGAALFSTFVGQMAGNALFQSRKGQIQRVSAFDMIRELKDQLDGDAKTQYIRLPEGVHVEGRKGSSNENTLELDEYINQIFRQHELDCDPEGKISDRLSEELEAASQMIAKDIRAEKLDAMSLINLVGERRIVRRAGKQVVGKDIVRAELVRLEHKMRHRKFVDDAKYFSEASFSKAQLRDAWNAMEPDERAVFSTFVPGQALEAAGIDPREIKALKDGQRNEMHQTITAVVNGLATLDDKKLKSLEATASEIRLIRDAHEMLQEDEKVVEKLMPTGSHGKESIDRPIANMVVHHVHHGGRLNELLHERSPGAE